MMERHFLYSLGASAFLGTKEIIQLSAVDDSFGLINKIFPTLLQPLP